MESSNTALRAKNDAAASKELRELRADTLSGLRYARSLIEEGSDFWILGDAIDTIERRWPA